MASGSNDRMKYSKVGTTWFFSPLLQTGQLARKLYEKKRQEAASIRIQKRLRAHKARISYTKLQAAAVAIQTGLRTMAAQNDHQNRRRTKAAKIIQVINALDGTIYRNFSYAYREFRYLWIN